jgi:hypothetical protein
MTNTTVFMGYDTLIWSGSDGFYTGVVLDVFNSSYAKFIYNYSGSNLGHLNAQYDSASMRIWLVPYHPMNLDFYIF